MAVFPTIQGLQVQIECNRMALKEYSTDKDEEKEPNTITKYVESKSGQKFTIHWHTSGSFKYADQSFIVYIILDGESVDNYIYFAPTMRSASEQIDSVRINVFGEHIKKLFVFTDLLTSESSCRAGLDMS